MSFSEEQKKLALHLINAPKTADELAKVSGCSSGKIANELKELVKLDLVEKKDGFPTRYSLKKEIAEELSRRKEIAEKDKFGLRVRATIELKAIEPELLKKQLDKLGEAIQNDPEFTVYNISKATTLKDDDWYSTFLDLTIGIKDFKTLVKFMYYYGPSSIEVLKPSTIQFDGHDLQEGLLDMAQMIHAYSNQLVKLMNRTEIERLNRQLYK
ncbi:MAG: helix-turn-helix domain-containing protein [Candidatus Micrarchaeota archaeon]